MPYTLRIPVAVLALLSILLYAMPHSAVAQAPWKTLIVTHDAHYPPISYIDENGKPAGLLIELWQAFGMANNILIRFELVDWQESINMVRNGKADVHGGLFFSKTRAQYFDFGPKIMEMSTRLFLRSNYKEEFESDKSLELGVVQGGLEEAFIRSSFPAHPVRTFKQNETMVKKALEGEVSAFVADYPIGTYYLHLFNGQDRFRVDRELYHGVLRPGVRRGERPLLRILEQGWQRVDDSEQRRIRQKWFRSQAITPKWVWPSILWGVAILVLFAGLLHNLFLRSALNRRTKALNEAIGELSEANGKLEHMATHDPLTGVPNRRMFMSRAQAEIRRCHRYASPLSVVLVDLDRFKAVNDTYGHAVGDQVLVGFCELVSSMVRTPDMFARYGGEEFALLLPETPMAQAREVAERIRVRVRETPLKTDSGDIHISMSAGVARSSPLSPDRMSEPDARLVLEQMLRQADRALYIAKRSGRNMVGEEPEQTEED